jgi:hypothetical protein
MNTSFILPLKNGSLVISTTFICISHQYKNLKAFEDYELLVFNLSSFEAIRKSIPSFNEFIIKKHLWVTTAQKASGVAAYIAVYCSIGTATLYFILSWHYHRIVWPHMVKISELCKFSYHGSTFLPPYSFISSFITN